MAATNEAIQIHSLPKLDNPDPCHLHPAIPQGSCLFVAPSASGKSTLIVNLILRRVFGVLVHYKRILVFSPTVYSDSSWDMLSEDMYHPFKIKCADGRRRRTAEVILDDAFSMEKLDKIMKDQGDIQRSERPNTLIILDDWASELSNTPSMQRLAFRGRHMKLWLWLATQLYRKVPRSLRVNVPYYIIFSVNSNELRTISEELAVGSVKEFEVMFRRGTAEPYGFLCVDMKRAPAKRFSFNFKKIDGYN